MMDSRSKIPFECGNEMLESGNGYIVCRDNSRGEDKLISMQNPASRELLLGVEKIQRNLITSH